jgi:hypothetical protein
MDVIVIPTGESIPGTDFFPLGGDDPDRCYKNYERETHRCEWGAGGIPQMIPTDGIERVSNARRLSAAFALKDFLTKLLNLGAWPT